MARNIIRPNDYLLRTAALASSFPVTFSAWYNEDNIGNGSLMSMSKEIDNTHYMSLVYVQGVDLRLQAIDGASQAVANTTAAPTANVWEHGCGVLAAQNDFRVYLNGGNKGTSSTDIGGFPSGMVNTTLGVLKRSALVNQYDGQLAESAIWSAALTDAEVAMLALGYSPLFVRPQSLISYWSLIGRTNPEIDLVGGYDMTLVSAPPTVAHVPVIYPVTPPTFAPPPLRGPRHGVSVYTLGGLVSV